MENELQVIVNQQVGKISFNFEEMKQQAIDMTKRYDSLVLSEDDVQPAKKDRAMLNKKFQDLEARRKEIEKTYMTPLNDFKAQIKEIGQIISDASASIDKQIKVFEDAAKEKKKANILEIYHEIVTDIQDYIPFDNIYNPKWENVATSMKSIREEIQTIYDSTKISIETISNMHSEKVQEALNMFKKDLSLNNAISFINRFEAEKARILEQEYKKQQQEAERKQCEEEQRRRKEEEERIRLLEREKAAEEERIRREERQRIEEEERVQREETEKIVANSIVQDSGALVSFVDSVDPLVTEEPFAIEEPFESEPPFTSKPEYTKTYVVTSTDSGFIELEKCLRELLISYEEI